MKQRNRNSRELFIRRIAHERSRKTYREEVARLHAAVRSALLTGQKADDLLVGEWQAALRENLTE